MKAQCWSDQVHQRGNALQLDSAEISVAWKIALLLVPADAQPVVGRLKWQMYVLGGFQLENCQTPIPRDCQHIQNSTLTAAVCKYLRVRIPRIPGRINARDVLGDDRFQPAF